MWQRQLVFRSKLTMHTAYDRKDNAEPASITALAVSKDHKTLYVGDARGRVFSWSVTEQPNRGMADHWLKDEGADQCVGCHVRYNIHFPSLQSARKMRTAQLLMKNYPSTDSPYMSANIIAATAAKCSVTSAAALNRRSHVYVS